MDEKFVHSMEYPANTKAFVESMRQTQGNTAPNGEDAQTANTSEVALRGFLQSAPLLPPVHDIPSEPLRHTGASQPLSTARTSLLDSTLLPSCDSRFARPIESPSVADAIFASPEGSFQPTNSANMAFQAPANQFIGLCSTDASSGTRLPPTKTTSAVGATTPLAGSMMPTFDKRDVIEWRVPKLIRGKLSQWKERAKFRLSQKTQRLSRSKKIQKLSNTGQRQSGPVLFRYEGYTSRRVVERRLPTGATRDERARQILRRIFERDIKVEVPLQNGDHLNITVRAWIDWFCTCNIFDQRIIKKLPPLSYITTEPEHYARTPGGPAYSKARFVGRWFCEDLDVFDSVYASAEFRVSDHDLDCDVIIGRTAILEHNLFQTEPPMPLIAPMGVRTPHIRIDPHNIHRNEEAARQARRHEAHQIEQGRTYQQQRHVYAHDQAHRYVAMAYAELYDARYRQASVEFDTLRQGR